MLWTESSLSVITVHVQFCLVIPFVLLAIALIIHVPVVALVLVLVYSALHTLSLNCISVPFRYQLTSTLLSTNIVNFLVAPTTSRMSVVGSKLIILGGLVGE